jgi:oligopeptide/dipeptide ABC transporter ATP-binding protein
LLDIQGLRVRLPTSNGYVTVVDGVNVAVETGSVVGIAGESGSGKTMSVLALLQLLPKNAHVEGRALYDGQDLLSLSPTQMRTVRGREIAMVFQNPMTSMHPMLTVGKSLTGHLRHHFKLGRREARKRAIAALEEVRIPDPEASFDSFPHQFSGGMRQRIAIASALICGPKLLIADEPTTALDVTVQAGIIGQIDRLRSETGLSVILITHDLGVISSVADQLFVMYSGRVAEAGSTYDVLRRPRHPYTKGLLGALPHPEGDADTRLLPIHGAPPTVLDAVAGCAFHPRCEYAVETCAAHTPPLVGSNGHRFACPVDPFKDA